MTAEAALRQAEAEGLTLLRSDSRSGYKSVCFSSTSCGQATPYQTQVRRRGRMVSLGHFATAEEAALNVARSPEGQAAMAAAAAPPAPPPKLPPMTALAALRQAEAEGLTLLRSESSRTGYKGVARNNSGGKPYKAEVWRGGRLMHLGCFATVEEAALNVARVKRSHQEEDDKPPPPTALTALTALAALRQAEAEGLTLLRSESSRTGYKGVTVDSSWNSSKPYKAEVGRGGRMTHLGCFATAEEAALNVARVKRSHQEEDDKPLPLTALAALRQAEAEGLTLLRSESGSTGYKGVTVDSRRSKPYKAEVRRDGKNVSLGSFATVEEAALTYARTPEAQAAVAAAAAKPAPPPMTAEEAALVLTRDLPGQAAAAPATSSRKRKVRSEEEPPHAAQPSGGSLLLKAPPTPVPMLQLTSAGAGAQQPGQPASLPPLPPLLDAQ